MRGTLNTRDRSAAVVGAGFAGLLCAYHLARRGYTVDIYEAAPRTGGMIRTVMIEHGFAEAAAHSFRLTAPMNDLCADLGVPLVHSKTHKKFILRDGRWRRFPLTAGEAATLFARAWRPARDDYASLDDFAHHHMGAGAARHLIAPMVNGIYAATADRLDPRLAFSGLCPPAGTSLLRHTLTRRKRRRYPTLGIAAPQGGMGALIDGLTRFLEQQKNVRLHLGQHLDTPPDKAGNVILTTPFNGTLGLPLIEYAPLISVTAFCAAPPKKEGVGILFAPDPRRRALGILFNSATFSHRTAREDTVHSYSVLLGGTSAPHLLHTHENEIRAIVTQELAEVCNHATPPHHMEVFFWPQAIPVYGAALRAAWQELDRGWCATTGHMVFGNAAGDVSLRGMCERAAEFFG